MTPLHLNPVGTEREYRDLVDALMADGSPSVLRRATMLRKDGREVQVEKTYCSSDQGREGNRWIITLARDVTARVAAELEVQRSRDAVREAEHIVAMIEDRERIARDVYDVVIKQLFAASLGLEATVHHGGDAARNEHRVREAVAAIDRAIHDLRSTIFATHEATSAVGDGLRTRMLAEVDDLTSDLGVDVAVAFDGALDDVEATVAHHVLPVIRDALSGLIGRHATAAEMTVSARDGLAITVSVDGPLESSHAQLDLHGLDARAAASGGTCELVEQRPGRLVLVWQAPRPRHQLPGDLATSGAAPPAPGVAVTGPGR